MAFAMIGYYAPKRYRLLYLRKSLTRITNIHFIEERKSL